MQYHEDGYRAGDPRVSEPFDTAQSGEGLPAELDVLIVGCGPAGLTLAAQLSAFPGVRWAIVEQKDGPLERGQADGIAVRTVEMFEAFGFADKVLREAYWVNETCFWTPGEDGKIQRSGRIEDTEEGLSEFPHVILNQARVHAFYLDVMKRSGHQAEPYYGRRLASLERDQCGVTVTFDRPKAQATETTRARYVVGCDGARSKVRQEIGRTLTGDSANQAWGVMDVLAVTDFPDIRLKCLIKAENEGSIVLIPREGGYMARFYVELDKLSEEERVRDRELAVEDLVAAVNRIIAPYSLDVKDVPWWSVYEIGQRLTNHFDDRNEEREPRVFIAGDACHTHSPKAGQGMNVSMQDAYNLGWKLGAVIEGRSPEQLLDTYSEERQAVAKELIDFDREWASVLSDRRSDPRTVQDYFQRHARYTAGTTIHYRQGLLRGPETHQALAVGYPVGMRFHSAPVIRLADAKPVELGHCHQADGRWRLYAFADSGRKRLMELCTFLEEDASSPLRRFTPDRANPDAVFDLRAILQEPHRHLELGDFPDVLRPTKGRLALQDYEKVLCADPRQDIFDLRGIDRAQGALVVVRPDQFVAHVLPLDGVEELVAFLEPVFLEA